MIDYQQPPNIEIQFMKKSSEQLGQLIRICNQDQICLKRTLNLKQILIHQLGAYSIFKFIILNINMKQQDSFEKINQKCKQKPLQTDRQFIINGEQDWEKIRAHNGVIVDKSQFIAKIFQKKFAQILVNRPRRWGKTLTKSMFVCFASCPIDSKGQIDEDKRRNINELFYPRQQGKKLFISSIESLKQQHFMNYIVLTLSFKQLICSSSIQIIKGFAELIQNCYFKHRYLKDMFGKYFDSHYCYLYQNCNSSNPTITISQLSNKIKFLCQMLSEFHNKKVITVIDDYDTPATNQEADKDSELKTQIAKSILVIIRGLVNNNESNIITLVFGVTEIRIPQFLSAQYSKDTVLCSDIDMDQMFGLTKDEIEKQLIKPMFSDDSGQLKHFHKDLMIQIQKLYKGYIKKSRKGQTVLLYNPMSVSKYLSSCKKYQQILTPMSRDTQNSLYFWPQKIDKSSSTLMSFINLRTKDHLFMRLYISLLKDTTISLENWNNIKEIDKSLYPNELLKKEIRQYTFEQMIFALIVRGYLTIKDNKIIIPNRQVKFIFKQYLSNIIKNQITQILNKVNCYDKFYFNIEKWSTCKNVFQIVIQQLYNYPFDNFSQQLLNTLLVIIINFLNVNNEYLILEQRKCGNSIRPDIACFSNKYRPTILQITKVINRQKATTYEQRKKKVTDKIEQGFFEVIQRNKLLGVLENYRCDKQTIIVRVVIGYKFGRVFRIEAKQVVLAYEQAKDISFFSEAVIKRKIKQIKTFKQLKEQLKKYDKYKIIQFFQSAEEFLKRFDKFNQTWKKQKENIEQNQIVLQQLQKMFSREQQQTQQLNMKLFDADTRFMQNKKERILSFSEKKRLKILNNQPQFKKKLFKKLKILLLKLRKEKQDQNESEQVQEQLWRPDEECEDMLQADNDPNYIEEQNRC